MVEPRTIGIRDQPDADIGVAHAVTSVSAARQGGGHVTGNAAATSGCLTSAHRDGLFDQLQASVVNPRFKVIHSLAHCSTDIPPGFNRSNLQLK